MKRVILLVLSLICICFSFYIPVLYIQESAGQQFHAVKPVQAPETKDIFRVAITLFGVNKGTGYVLSFVEVNNVTSARYFNASKDDLKDGNGIVDSLISFPNATVVTGSNFTACNVILKDLKMSCKSALNIEGRIETVQFVLPTFKQPSK